MKTKTIISIVVYAVLLVVVLGVVAFVFAYINNGQKNFYVQYGDEKISHKLENVELEKNATSLFYCKNVLGITDKQEQATNFTVRVQANSEALSEYDFTGFTLDGKTKDFFKGTDITNGFDIQLGEGHFTLYLPETLTLMSVLEKVYPDAEIAGVPEVDLYAKECLSLIVYCDQEKATVTIGFH